MAQETSEARTEVDRQDRVVPLPTRKARRKGKTLLISLAALVLLAATTCYYLFFVAPFESTDDAFIDGYITQLSSRVPGQVLRLLVHDNEWVKRGQMLVQLDPRDFRASLAQAQAQLAAARGALAQSLRQVSVNQARVLQARADSIAAEANAKRALDDLRRYESVQSRAVSKIALDQVRDLARTTTAQVTAVHSQIAAAQAAVAASTASVTSARAGVQLAEAGLRQAGLNLSYTSIIAPVDGRVTARTVQAGNYVQPGEALMALAQKDVWVTANFKETQLTYMRPGQPVTIEMDAYPSQRFRGRIDSLQAGTGARFSLLPPENAVGNYVKVVQRVPVKIDFEQPLPQDLDIAPGMSVEPRVRVK
jgi:membrane fusion protein, multidrug efflux system